MVKITIEWRDKAIQADAKSMSSHIRLDGTGSLVAELENIVDAPLSEPELKPCPFCGETAFLDTSQHGTSATYQVRCTGCDIGRTPWATVRADAVGAWNRRAQLWTR